MMNLGAFAVVAAVRNATGSEEIGAFRGLVARSPGLGVAFVVFVFALLGLPPLAGFTGKFVVFASVYETARSAGSGVGPSYTLLLIVGLANTALSAGVYLKVLKTVALDDVPESGQPVALPAGMTMLTGVLAAGLVAMGVWWTPILEMARFAVG
jgi:NADH-quinone oxidoreductase subunit N